MFWTNPNTSRNTVMVPISKRRERFPGMLPAYKGLLRKTEKLQHCPSSKQFPSSAAGPDLTSCHSENAELRKARDRPPRRSSPNSSPAEPLEPGQLPRSRSALIDSGLGFPWKTAPRLPDGWSGAKGAREGCLMRDHPASSLENVRDSHKKG